MSQISTNVTQAFAAKVEAEKEAQQRFELEMQPDVQKEKFFFEFIKALDPTAKITVDGKSEALDPERHAETSVASRAEGKRVQLTLNSCSISPSEYTYGAEGLCEVDAELLIKKALNKAQESKNVDLLEKLGAALPTLSAPLDNFYNDRLQRHFAITTQTLSHNIEHLDRTIAETEMQRRSCAHTLVAINGLQQQLLAQTAANQTNPPAAEQGQVEQKAK